MNVALEPADGELVLTRDIKASRTRVFAAWTDVRLSSAWWVPQNCTLLSCEMDVRVGGRWRRRLRVPDGGVIAKYGVYREIVPPAEAAAGRLVFSYGTEYADGTVDPETLVTLTFEELADGRTRLTLRHSGFREDASRVSHIGGWTSALERLLDFATS